MVSVEAIPIAGIERSTGVFFFFFKSWDLRFTAEDLSILSPFCLSY